MVATTRTNESRVKDNYKFGLKNSKDYLPRKNSMDYKKREYVKGSYEDEDYSNSGARSHKSSEDRHRAISKEQLPDKYEAYRRLEREKKALQKKLREEEHEKTKRPAMKQKRSAKSDWTKDYVYGLIDEDNDFTDY